MRAMHMPSLPTGWDLDAARAAYQAQGWVKLPGFFGSELVSAVLDGLATGTFEPRSHGQFGSEVCLAASPLLERLERMMNDESTRRFADELTGAGPFGCFQGRIYRIVPGRGHGDGWHTDMVAGRMVAVSVNLSEHPYRGGVLRIRRAGETELLAEVPNLGLGDAVLFRLSHGLEHRISDIEGEEPKTAYAGWFRVRPEYADIAAGRANW
ncbi:MAG: 2OG-Fe(II) oxygenase [Polyangiaceae bacterium]